MPWPVSPLIALILDLIFKDPPGWPHPVRLLGLMIERLEAWARSLKMSLRLAGGLGMALTVLLTWAIVLALTSLPMIGWLWSIYFGYAGLALGGLLQEGGRVAAFLHRGEVEKAKNALAGLVSRDVAHLDESALRRALAETVSENFNDAFVAPFLYLLLLGPAGLWAYKAVSTLDSMWGYKTDHWKDIGWASARSDDILAFVPARLSAVCLLSCAWIMRLPHRPTLNAVARNAALTESPNAGWPMAAAALILHGGLGGPTPYFGINKEKPWIGPREMSWDDRKIAALFRLTRNAGLAFALVGLLMYFAVHFA